MTRRWLLAIGLTLLLAVPVGIGVAAAAGGSSSAPGTDTGPTSQPTGIASCPAIARAGGMTQHMKQMPHDPADMAEHRKNMMGVGAMMGAPSSP